jgi:hypothetical protein
LRIPNLILAISTAFLISSVSAQVLGPRPLSRGGEPGYLLFPRDISVHEAVPAAVLAPRTLTKAGPAAFVSIDFALKPLVHGPYELQLDSSDVANVKVILNGVEYSDFRDFQLEHSQSRTVKLAASNTLAVELKGRANESLSISIMGQQYSLAASYSGLDLFPGAPGSGDIDWRTKGAVTGVKNQGQCDSDWTFSTTGAVEGAAFVKTKALPSLSEQQLIDCARNAASLNACNGGSPAAAIQYVMTSGAASEASYPYTARQGTCKVPSPVNSVAARVTGILRNPPGDDNFLLQLLRSKGPVSVIVNANWIDAYGRQTAANKKLIESGNKCETEAPAFEALLLVGAATENGTAYWILKTARGTTFGNQGYVYLARGQNTCGIADYAIVPLM